MDVYTRQASNNKTPALSITIVHRVHKNSKIPAYGHRIHTCKPIQQILLLYQTPNCPLSLNALCFLDFHERWGVAQNDMGTIRNTSYPCNIDTDLRSSFLQHASRWVACTLLGEKNLMLVSSFLQRVGSQSQYRSINFNSLLNFASVVITISDHTCCFLHLADYVYCDPFNYQYYVFMIYFLFD